MKEKPELIRIDSFKSDEAKEDRLIEVLEGDGWQFQPENSLPYLLKPGTKLKILKDEYHRLIKGINNLKIKITKVL